MSAQVCQVYDDGWRHAVIAKEGREYAHLVVINSPIDSLRIPLDVLDEQVRYVERDAAQVARQIFDMGVRLGITERAKALLEGVIHSVDVDIDEEMPIEKCDVKP